MNAFKLLVASLFAAAFVYVFLLYFAPYFFPAGDALKELDKGLERAREISGVVHQSQIRFQPGYRMQAGSLDNRIRSVTFQCYDPRVCCPLEEEPHPGICEIAVGNREILAVKGTQVQAWYRCIDVRGLFACRVYFGSKPPQLEIVSVDISKTIDLSAGAPTVSVNVKNAGNFVAHGVKAWVKAHVEGEDCDEEGKPCEDVLAVPEQFASLDAIEPGQSRQASFALPLPSAGSYAVAAGAEAEDAGRVERMVSVKATGSASQSDCRAIGTGQAKLQRGECVIEYLCEGCEFSYECKLAWGAAGFQEDAIRDYEPGRITHVTSMTQCQ